MIREMIDSDKERVLEIYGFGIAAGNATFEIRVPSWHEWESGHHIHSRFVFEENDKVVGWVALSPVSPRKVYSGVAEISIYVDPDYQNNKIGSRLMEKLIVSSEENGIWTLYSAVFPENEATLKLHRNFGFRIIGRRERIAMQNGKWRDTLLLERRSNKVGI